MNKVKKVFVNGSYIIETIKLDEFQEYINEKGLKFNDLTLNFKDKLINASNVLYIEKINEEGEKE